MMTACLTSNVEYSFEVQDGELWPDTALFEGISLSLIT